METIETFRVEFNEKGQAFHHAYAFQNKKPNTFGWKTVTEHCTDKEFMIFKAYLKREKKEKYTYEYVLKSFTELKSFWNELLNYNITIN